MTNATKIRAKKIDPRTERLNQLRAEANVIIATGKCPICGRALRRNLSLTGWYQCEQFGAENFRKDKSVPECGFQAFGD